LSESRFAESILIVFFLLKIKLFEIVDKGFHAYKIVLEHRQAGLASISNRKEILVVNNLPEALCALTG
jgi:hypothetical protein